MVHSVLPEPLADAAAPVLEAAGIGLRRHASAMAGAEAAAADPSALALLGPFRSRDVCFAVEATAPAGVPLIAPVATWAGVTRTDEPGCEEDPADHRGTLLRMVARDTEVAARIAADLRASGRGARVVAGDHEYGAQLEKQLRLAGLPDGDDVLVLAGLPGGEEIARVRALAGVPVIAFDGVQGEDLGDREVLMALPFAPIEAVAFDHMVYGAAECRRAAELIVAADRDALLDSLRAAGPFDAFGDPVDPPVWLWRAARDWTLTPDRAI